MDSSRRAVESYWRSRMIDGATSDEDKVTPVYKLDEICELLRSSNAGIVKEVSEFILKRLEHKSPIVKQKALRVIKYAVGKSGTEFRREMQRHSAAVRQLFHYKGHLDPLKGDSLNKAVRDTSHEAISAIFASEDSKPTPAEDLSRRIQGFGNTNFEMPSEEKKSFLSEVVELGSASFKQGLNSITAAHLMMKNDNGSYKSPTLRRSLTTEREIPDRNERGNYQSENWGSSGISKNMVSGPWRQDSLVNNSDTLNGDSGSSYAGSKSREETLLETIVTVGGVRLQPSRDAIQLFLVEALKVDAVALSLALELKLQSHLWQVRMKAVCVLESILRKKDDAHFFIVASYFSENKDALLKCSESPQASLSEKAKKVLSLLDGEPTAREKNHSQMPSSVKSETTTAFQMPNLIDTEEPNNSNGIDDFSQKQTTYDLFGDELITEHKTEKEGPFADVSFHATEDKEPGDDLFSGLMIDDKQATKDIPVSENKDAPELYDIFGSNSEILQEQKSDKKDVNDLMAGLFINEKTLDTKDTPWAFSKANFSSPSIRESHQIPNDALNGISNSQIPGMNPNSMPYMVPMQYNPTFTSQTMNYSAMGNFIAQQQLLATMSSFQQFGNLNAQGTTGLGYVSGQSKKDGGYSSALPDIFHHPNIPSQPHSSMMSSSKKEENRAFDFISEHLSAARDPKRVV